MDIRDQWQTQATRTGAPSATEMLKKENSFSQRVAWRNSLEITVAVALIPTAFAIAATSSRGPILRLCYASWSLPCAFIAYRLWAHGRWAKRNVGALSTKDQIGALRANLERQRKLVGTAWAWYVLPIITALTATSLALTFEAPGRSLLSGALDLASLVVLALLVIGLNRRGSRQLSDTIQALDRCLEEPRRESKSSA